MKGLYLISMLALAACANKTSRMDPDQIVALGRTAPLEGLTFFGLDSSSNFVEMSSGSIIYSSGSNPRDFWSVDVTDANGFRSRFPWNSFTRNDNGMATSAIVETSRMYGFIDSSGLWHYNLSDAALAGNSNYSGEEIRAGEASLNLRLTLGGSAVGMQFADFGMFAAHNTINIDGNLRDMGASYIPFIAEFSQYKHSIDQVPIGTIATFTGNAIGFVQNIGTGNSASLSGAATLDINMNSPVGLGREALKISFDSYHTFSFNDAGTAIVTGDNRLKEDFGMRGQCQAGCHGVITGIRYYGESFQRIVEAAGNFDFYNGSNIYVNGVFGVRLK